MTEFSGSWWDKLYEAALVDFHQYVIDRILKYKGD
jgi:hypothetical protein